MLRTILYSPEKKKRRRFEHHYSRSSLDEAVARVRSRELSVHQVSVLYNIPRSTVSSRLRKDGWFAKENIPSDPPLPPQIMTEIGIWLAKMAEIGCQSVAQSLPSIVREVCEMFNEHTMFPINNLPTVLYCKKLLRDHKDFPYDATGSLPRAKNTQGHCVIGDWMKKLRNHLELRYGLDADSFLSGGQANVSQIFCCYEAGTLLKREDGGCGKLLFRNVLDSHERHRVLSMYTCVGANGVALRPMVTVKNRTAERKYIARPLESDTGSYEMWSKEGVMDSDILLDWLHMIVEEVTRREVSRPLLVFLDQAVQHVSLAALDYCQINLIILFFLPGQTNSVHLPFGMNLFFKVKEKFTEIIDSQVKKALPKLTSIDLLSETWQCVVKTSLVQREFEKLGLVPLNDSKLKVAVENSTLLGPTVIKTEPVDQDDSAEAVSEQISSVSSDQTQEKAKGSDQPSSSKRRKLKHIIASKERGLTKSSRKRALEESHSVGDAQIATQKLDKNPLQKAPQSTVVMKSTAKRRHRTKAVVRTSTPPKNRNEAAMNGPENKHGEQEIKTELITSHNHSSIMPKGEQGCSTKGADSTMKTQDGKAVVSDLSVSSAHKNTCKSAQVDNLSSSSTSMSLTAASVNISNREPPVAVFHDRSNNRMKILTKNPAPMQRKMTKKRQATGANSRTSVAKSQPCVLKRDLVSGTTSGAASKQKITENQGDAARSDLQCDNSGEKSVFSNFCCPNCPINLEHGRKCGLKQGLALALLRIEAAMSKDILHLYNKRLSQLRKKATVISEKDTSNRRTSGEFPHLSSEKCTETLLHENKNIAGSDPNPKISDLDIGGGACQQASNDPTGKKSCSTSFMHRADPSFLIWLELRRAVEIDSNEFLNVTKSVIPFCGILEKQLLQRRSFPAVATNGATDLVSVGKQQTAKEGCNRFQELQNPHMLNTKFHSAENDCSNDSCRDHSSLCFKKSLIQGLESTIVPSYPQSSFSVSSIKMGDTTSNVPLDHPVSSTIPLRCRNGQDKLVQTDQNNPSCCAVIQESAAKLQSFGSVFGPHRGGVCVNATNDGTNSNGRTPLAFCGQSDLSLAHSSGIAPSVDGSLLSTNQATNTPLNGCLSSRDSGVGSNSSYTEQFEECSNGEAHHVQCSNMSTGCLTTSHLELSSINSSQMALSSGGVQGLCYQSPYNANGELASEYYNVDSRNPSNLFLGEVPSTNITSNDNGRGFVRRHDRNFNVPQIYPPLNCNVQMVPPGVVQTGDRAGTRLSIPGQNQEYREFLPVDLQLMDTNTSKMLPLPNTTSGQTPRRNLLTQNASHRFEQPFQKYGEQNPASLNSSYSQGALSQQSIQNLMATANASNFDNNKACSSAASSFFPNQSLSVEGGKCSGPYQQSAEHCSSQAGSSMNISLMKGREYQSQHMPLMYPTIGDSISLAGTGQPPQMCSETLPHDLNESAVSCVPHNNQTGMNSFGPINQSSMNISSSAYRNSSALENTVCASNMNSFDPYQSQDYGQNGFSTNLGQFENTDAVGSCLGGSGSTGTIPHSSSYSNFQDINPTLIPTSEYPVVSHCLSVNSDTAILGNSTFAPLHSIDDSCGSPPRLEVSLDRDLGHPGHLVMGPHHYGLRSRLNTSKSDETNFNSPSALEDAGGHSSATVIGKQLQDQDGNFLGSNPESVPSSRIGGHYYHASVGSMNDGSAGNCEFPQSGDGQLRAPTEPSNGEPCAGSWIPSTSRTHYSIASSSASDPACADSTGNPLKQHLKPILNPAEHIVEPNPAEGTLSNELSQHSGREDLSGLDGTWQSGDRADDDSRSVESDGSSQQLLIDEEGEYASDNPGDDTEE